MNYWLMKSEPGVSASTILPRQPGKTAPWWGVRNYQARNFMRDQMLVGDRVFFYHSSCAEPGIARNRKGSKLAYPDETQFDRKSEYFDPKASRHDPRWFNVDVTLVRKPVSSDLRNCARIRNSRRCASSSVATALSITPHGFPGRGVHHAAALGGRLHGMVDCFIW